jgi:hypothetical protein
MALILSIYWKECHQIMNIDLASMGSIKHRSKILREQKFQKIAESKT